MFNYKLIQSKIGKKIGLLVFIQIFFIIVSFSILSYYQSQMTYLGDSINIEGKNRLLTSNLMFHVSEYYLENESDVSKINSAIDQLESNVLALRQGGNIADIDLKPLPIDFLNDWNKIYQEWICLKTILTDNIIVKSVDDDEQQFINSEDEEEYDAQDKVIKGIIEQKTFELEAKMPFNPTGWYFSWFTIYLKNFYIFYLSNENMIIINTFKVMVS